MKPVTAPVILFANSKNDLEVVKHIGVTPYVVRIAIHQAARLFPHVPQQANLWIDPTIDSYPQAKNHQWTKYHSKMELFSLLTDTQFLSAPKKDTILPGLESLIEDCLKFKPAVLSVPQLALTDGVERHKINRMLATLTGEILQKRDFHGELVVPLILTHKNQYASKSVRTSKLKLAQFCIQKTGAKGLWIVATDFDDESGVSTNDERIENLIALHTEAEESAPTKWVAAGPYWATGLLLWAKGLADFVVTCAGSGYAYTPPGRFVITGSPKSRIALEPLKKRVCLDLLFQNWLQTVISQMPATSPERSVLVEVARDFSLHSTQQACKRQIAGVWFEWIAQLLELPSSGRSVALYQNFSQAFMLGKTMNSRIPSERSNAQNPYVPAELLMRHCL